MENGVTGSMVRRPTGLVRNPFLLAAKELAMITA
jgi:hypothetical protein